MSEKERILDKYTNLRDSLMFDLSFHFGQSTIGAYDLYTEYLKGAIEEINGKLRLGDIAFLRSLYGRLTHFITGSKDNIERILQGKFTKARFESSYGDFMKDDQIDPVIRNKLKEIGNKVIENEKDPLVERFYNTFSKFKNKNDSLYVEIKNIDDKLIKYFLEHE